MILHVKLTINAVTSAWKTLLLFVSPFRHVLTSINSRGSASSGSTSIHFLPARLSSIRLSPARFAPFRFMSIRTMSIRFSSFHSASVQSPKSRSSGNFRSSKDLAPHVTWPLPPHI